MSIYQNKCVFWDRDGVLTRLIEKNGKFRSPWTLAEVEYFPGVEKALQRTRKLGFLNIIVTTQPDVATGEMLAPDLYLINDMMKQTLPLDYICYCLDRSSEYYKPLPGMIWLAQKNYDIDLSKS